MAGKMLWMCWGVLLLAVSTAQAQTYQLKFKQYGDVGKKVTIKREQQGRTKVRKTYLPTKVNVDNDVPILDFFEYTTVVVAQSAERPVKFQTFYTKMESGMPDSRYTRPYQGRTVPFAWQGGRYIVADAAGLAQSDVADLENDANDGFSAMMVKTLPGRPVRLQEIWQVQPASLAVFLYHLKDKVDLVKSDASGKLVKVYQHEGQQRGIIEVQGSLIMRDYLAPFVADVPMAMELSIRFDFALDGSSTAARLDLSAAGRASGLETDGVSQLEFDFSQTVQLTQSGEQ
jgi:hypothetical protein